MSPYNIEDIDESYLKPEGIESFPLPGADIYTDKYYSIDQLRGESYDRLHDKCDFKEAETNYDFIVSALGGTRDFESIWNYLKYITTKKGETPSDECAIAFYGKYLKHDHRNKILMKKGKNSPEGWICNDENPFRKECEFIPIHDPKKRFIKWVALLNDDRDDLAYSKDEIIRDSKHWDLQNKHGWKFVLPDRDDPSFESKKNLFIKSMNQYAGDLILETYSQKREKNEIMKEKEASQYYDENEFNYDYREPLRFTIDKRVSSIVLPLSPSDAIEIEYIIKNFKKEQKDRVIRLSTLPDEKRNILKHHTISNKNKSIKDKEREIFETQISLLAKKVGESLENIAERMNLCGNGMDFTSYYKINDSAKKRRANHFNFSNSICIDTNLFMRQFKVEPLFNGWANTRSINSKLFSIDTKFEFMKEYRDPSPDIPDNLKLNLQQKIHYADNTPLILSLSTGKAMMKRFFDNIPKSYKKIQTYEITYNNDNVENKSEFHRCVVDKIKDYLKNHRINEINGVQTFPISIKTNSIKIKTPKGAIRTLHGIEMDFGLLPENFEDRHVGVVFNYKDKDGLRELEKFLENGYKMQNYALKSCYKI